MAHRKLFIFAMGVFLTVLGSTNAQTPTETVDVKYRGTVNLAPFNCQSITTSVSIRCVPRLSSDLTSGGVLPVPGQEVVETALWQVCDTV